MSRENETADEGTCPCAEALAAAEQLKGLFAVAGQWQTPKKVDWCGAPALCDARAGVLGPCPCQTRGPP